MTNQYLTLKNVSNENYYWNSSISILERMWSIWCSSYQFNIAFEPLTIWLTFDHKGTYPNAIVEVHGHKLFRQISGYIDLQLSISAPGIQSVINVILAHRELSMEINGIKAVTQSIRKLTYRYQSDDPKPYIAIVSLHYQDILSDWYHGKCWIQSQSWWCHESWHKNACCITGPLWGESTGDRWIPLTKGQ